MAEEGDIVWNKYIGKYGKEPSDASKLLNFSKNKANDCINLNFATARKVHNVVFLMIIIFEQQFYNHCSYRYSTEIKVKVW